MGRIVGIPLTVLLAVGSWGQGETGSSATNQAPVAPSASSASNSPVEILTDVKGVDFGPYLKIAIATIKKNWYSVIPTEAMPPTLKRGKVVVEFDILRDGEVKNLHYFRGSGDVAMDRAAYAGITASNPFPSLPAAFTGDYLRLRFTFRYNPGPDDTSGSAQGNAVSNEQVRLSEILISTQECALCGTSLQVTAARATCEALLQQIKGGAKFEDVAKANSNDGVTAAQGGDLGYFPRGKLAPSIEDIVFGMKVGDVSGVIRTKQGFIILKVTDHRDADAKASPATGIQ